MVKADEMHKLMAKTGHWGGVSHIGNRRFRWRIFKSKVKGLNSMETDTMIAEGIEYHPQTAWAKLKEAYYSETEHSDDGKGE